MVIFYGYGRQCGPFKGNVLLFEVIYDTEIVYLKGKE